MIYPTPTYVCFRLLQIQSFFRFRLTFLCFKFHWYLHCSNINTFSTSQIGDILHFNKLFFLTFKFKCSSHSYLFLHGSGSSFDNHWWHQQHQLLDQKFAIMWKFVWCNRLDAVNGRYCLSVGENLSNSLGWSSFYS